VIDFFGGDGRNRTEKGRVVDFFLGAMDEIGLKKITRMDQLDCDDRKNTNIYISYR
jgi:hypothetical protein